jgi:large subunit ribosomal protein L21
MYAIVKTGGKQYRVERGQSLLVERLPVEGGASVTLEPLLFVDGATVLDGGELSGVSVRARVVAHERGPKLRVVKFKPKRGYKRRNGHRQELTRVEVTEIRVSGGGRHGGEAAEPVTESQPPAEHPAPVAAQAAPAPAGGEAPATLVVEEAPAAEVVAETVTEPVEQAPVNTTEEDNGGA